MFGASFGSRCGSTRLCHDSGRQSEPFRSEHDHFHPAHRSHVNCCCRYGQRQSARVIRPGQNKPAVLWHREVVHRLPVGQRLTRMIGRRLEVDERLVDQLSHRPEVRLGEVIGKVFSVRKGADAERVAIGSEHRDSFADVLSGRAVHDRSELGLELPRSLARGDHKRASPESGHPRLE